LLDSLNNANNTFNSYFLNCLTKSLMTSDLINRLFNNYLEHINKAISNASQSSFINNGNSLNNSNIIEIWSHKEYIYNYSLN